MKAANKSKIVNGIVLIQYNAIYDIRFCGALTQPIMKLFAGIGIIVLLCLIAGCTGCTKVPDQIEPTISHSVQDRYLTSLPSPFSPLSEEERAQDWGREMLIGHAFAAQLDLYQAITAYKRAEILIPAERKSRLLEIQYEVLLCYYVALKWDDVIYTFQNSQLKTADSSFPVLHDMMLILYDTYIHQGDEREAERTLNLIHAYFPDESQKLYLSKALIQANLPIVQRSKNCPPQSPTSQNF